ncbi:MAG: FG-GAP-like repeat-containing protein, partial [Gammaproteobacteria bacterium]|nr:FG-GAP-like repeat-containing protein [Gammaproteobacteria bacterium]
TGVEAGLSWQYQVDETGSWIEGLGNIFLATAGTHSYLVRQIDRAGNTSDASSSLSVTYTSLATSLSLALQSDTGSSSSDHLTYLSSVNISGLSSGSSSEYQVDGTGNWTTLAIGISNFTAQVGLHSYQVRQTDGKGEITGLSALFRVDLDTLVPMVPVLQLASDTGSIAIDRVTKNPTITVTDLEANASWQYQVDGTGSWMMGSGSSLLASEGSHAYLVRQVDFAGNHSHPTALSRIANGTGGFALTGAVGGGYSGYSVSKAGDINGDGYADLMVGAPYTGTNGVDSGTSYVVFGKADWSGVAEFNLQTLANGADGFALTGEADGDESGTSISGVGDINKDGYADLIVGAYGSSHNGIGSGTSYVVFGKADWSGVETLSLQTIAEGKGGFALMGEADGDGSGNSVSGAGDINGDGYVDLIVGAYGADSHGANSGTSYVVFGKADWSGVGTLSLQTIAEGTGGFALTGEADGDGSGYSVSGVGDINGDGYADLMVGAYGADRNGVNSGTSYVVFGKSNWSGVGTLSLQTIAEGTGGFALTGEAGYDYSGYSVSSAGDINGDGYADLMVGVPFANSNGFDSGTSYVVFGKSNWSGVGTLSLQTIAEGTGGFALTGEGGYEYSSASISAVGDINKDGYADVIVGAYSSDHNGFESGTSYVVFGKADWSGVSSLNLSTILNGMGGFALTGDTDYDSSGRSVSGAGDINGDGYADFMVGAPYADRNGNESGTSYVVFGQANWRGTLTAILDTSAPSALILVLTDTGTDTTDGLTNNSTISVTSLETNAVWEYQVDGTGSWTTGTGSSWLASEGTHTYLARQIDTAGNTSMSSSVLTVILDTDVAIPDLTFSDTGANTTDGITTHSTISVTGLEANAAWEYQIDGTGSWMVGTGSTFLAIEGSHSYIVHQTDFAGNISENSLSRTVVFSTLSAPSMKLDSSVQTLGLDNSTCVTSSMTLMEGESSCLNTVSAEWDWNFGSTLEQRVLTLSDMDSWGPVAGIDFKTGILGGLQWASLVGVDTVGDGFSDNLGVAVDLDAWSATFEGATDSKVHGNQPSGTNCMDMSGLGHEDVLYLGMHGENGDNLVGISSPWNTLEIPRPFMINDYLRVL